jgi:prephenate dehydratase
VASGNSDVGVVPFENSTFGVVDYTLECLVDRDSTFGDIYIIDEGYLRVSHSLLGFKAIPVSPTYPSPKASNSPIRDSPEPAVSRSKPLTGLNHIERIYSHPQAFGQCEIFLNAHTKHAEKIETTSTSKAAENAKNDLSGASAAIASKLAAQLFGLDILAESIENQEDNTTRFFVICKGSPNASDATERSCHSPTKSLVKFRLNHGMPGALANVLNVFRSFELNITSINTRPSPLHPFQYMFFVEFEGSKLNDPEGRVQGALRGLDQYTTDWRWLGSWDDTSATVVNS